MPTKHPDRFPVKVIAALLLSILVIGVDFSFLPELEEDYNDDFYDHPDTVDFFPDFNASSEIFVVDVFDDFENETIDRGMILTLSCLQGLVNRQRAEVFIDFKGELHGVKDDWYWKFFIDNYKDAYNLTFSVITYLEFIDMFIHHASGIVVYDKENKDTINVAVTMAGINDWVAADKDTAAWLNKTYDIGVFQDLHHGWSGSRAVIYEKAFELLYPSCNKGILFASLPIVWGTDYVVACRGFVFCHNPGPFTSPQEKALTKRIMRETPADIPVIGWFEQPTGIEENYMVQLASGQGKIFLGAYKVPNKSFLTAYSTSENYSNPIKSRYTDDDGNYPGIYQEPNGGDVGGKEQVHVEDKIYLSLAITDGDNLGFMAYKMREELWNSSIRGSVPIAWSINPLMNEVAPSILHYFYATATENDTFVCGPSGSGYFYPGFTSDNQRSRWLQRTASQMDELDLRHIWLLNSFTTFEILYPEKVLEDYVEILSPEGMMLDYGDVPEGRKMWMQGAVAREEGGKEDDNGMQQKGEEENIAAPVIRSMHIWGDTDNFLAKLLVESDGTPDGDPVFAFAPIMSADLTLDTIPELLEKLDDNAELFGRDYEIVSIDDLFYLMERYYVEKAVQSRNDVEELARLFGEVQVAKGDDAYDTMVSTGVAGNDGGSHGSGIRHLTAYHAYRSIEYHDQAEDRASLAVSLMVTIGIIAAAVFILFRRNEISDRKEERNSSDEIQWFIVSFLLLFTSILILFSATYRILYMNFWNYLFIGGAVAVIAVGQRVFKHRMFSFSPSSDDGQGNCGLMGVKLIVLMQIIAVVGLIFHPAAYLFIPLFTIYLASFAMVRLGPRAPPSIIAAIVLSISLSPILMTYSLLPLSLIVIWFVFSVLLLFEGRTGNWNTSDSFSFPNPLFSAGLLVFFVAIQDIPFNRFLSISSGYRMEFLAASAVVIPLLSAVFGYTLHRFIVTKKKELEGVLWASASLASLPVLLVILLAIIDGRFAIFLIFWLYGSAITVGVLSSVALPRNSVIDQQENSIRFLTFMVVFFILGLVLATMPPIAFTVYVISLPLALVFVFYHLPLTLLVLSGPMICLPAKILMDRKNNSRNLTHN